METGLCGTIIAACVAGIGLGALASLAQTETLKSRPWIRRWTGAIPSTERFSFYVNGRSSECELQRFGDDLMRAIGSQCRDLPHELADATDWNEAGRTAWSN